MMTTIKDDQTTITVIAEHPGDIFARAYQAAVWERIRIANFPHVCTIISIVP